MTDLNIGKTITGYVNAGRLGGAPSDTNLANDGNPATRSVLPAGGQGGANWPEHGWESDLGSPQWVGEVAARMNTDFGPEFHTVLNAPYGVNNNYGSRIQYWNGGSWVDAPGSFTYVDSNSPRGWIYTFTTPVLTQKLRLEYGGKQTNNLWAGQGLFEWNITEGFPPGRFQAQIFGFIH